MADFKARLPKRRTVFKVLTISTIVVLVLFAGLTAYVYKESVGRFQLRRLSLPTRIYTDYTPLRAGVPLQRDALLEKLERLGYRESKGVSEAGEYSYAEGGVDLHTRQFRHPSGEYDAQAVRLTFRDNAISEVVSLRNGGNVETAALEPELLTSILSDELENRQPVMLRQVPKHLQDAVIATEDVRFWRHPGVDPLGIFRALVRNIRAGDVQEGGSTLTQQLVKNYYLTSERTMKRKIMEAFMALVLDAKYSKEEILEAYLNDIYLGRNRSISILGVGEASRFYFGKPVAEISVAQAAMLAALIRSPNNYSPFVDPQRAMTRRNVVLDLMLKHKKIDKATYEKAKAEPLPQKPFRRRTGLASIPFYVDRVVQEMATDYGIADVKGRGLQIYTAIDLEAQDFAAQTIEDSLRRLEKSSRRLRRANDPLQGVLIHVDVPTGEIRALVGGRNYEASQFNRALNSKRQVGSLFKPFVYLTAFEPSLSNQNITPATLVSDTRFVLKRRFSANWSPRNYEDVYRGTVTVRRALVESLNSATVRLGLASGIPAVLKTAKTLGITEELDDNPAVLLGSEGIPPIQMADSYATMARMGSRLPMRTIRFVMNDRGGTISAGEKVDPVQVYPARDVYLVVNIMEDVINRGTAGVARRMGFKRVAAGKTGTTNDKRDAWFIGFTPQTLALTWVGFDDNSPTGLSGSDGAVPIWTRYMLAVTAGHANSEFAAPGGISFAEMDDTTGGLVTPYCPPNLIVNQAFKAGTEPYNACSVHQLQPPPLPMVDQFGNPIDPALTATDMTSAAPPYPPGLPPPTDTMSTPIPTPTPAPPPVTTTTAEPAREPVRLPAPMPQPPTPTPQPPPATNTVQPPPATNTVTPPTTTT